MKLGELLIRKGIIDWKQLEKALSDQLIHGGSLGTCLIENGFIDEPTLGQALAEASGTKCAPPHAFRNLSRRVIGSLPFKLVVKYSAIPFRQDNRALAVAMIQPNDLVAVDELSFASGCKIVAWVAPEMRILQAMERYYDVPRRHRYIALSQSLDPSDPSSDLDLARMIVRPGGEWDDDAGTDATDGDAAAEPVATAWEAGSSLEAVSQRLCRCKSSEELADAIVGYTSRGAARIALFRVQNGEASVWRTSGIEMGSLDESALRFRVASEPIFSLMRGEEYFRGELPDDEDVRAFHRKLKIDPPAEALIVPIHLNDQLMGMFYADGGPTGPIIGETQDYLRVMRKLALSLHVILLRKQILVA